MLERKYFDYFDIFSAAKKSRGPGRKMVAIKAAHLFILCQVMLAVSAGGVVTTTKKPKTKSCLTKIKCDGEFCEPVEDKDGCYYCACPKYTCANVKCPKGKHCRMKQVTCVTTPCFPKPVCEPDEDKTIIKECPMIECRPFCKLVDGPDKCPKCDCPKTCEHVKCPDDQKCVMDTAICKKEPCDSPPICIPKSVGKNCPRELNFLCKKPCESDIGPNGCPKCSCPKECKDKKCNDDEQCELLKVQCFRAPCFPIPTCFPKPKTCRGRPNVKRCLKDMFSIQWTYNTSAKACEWFLYYGCTPSLNTFKNKVECLNTCPAVPPKCPPHVCAVGLHCPQGYALDENGCETCVCLD